MSELIIFAMMCSVFAVKLIIFFKCHKAKGACENKDCKLRYWCNKYDKRKELIDYRIEHIEKTENEPDI